MDTKDFIRNFEQITNQMKAVSKESQDFSYDFFKDFTSTLNELLELLRKEEQVSKESAEKLKDKAKVFRLAQEDELLEFLKKEEQEQEQVGKESVEKLKDKAKVNPAQKDCDTKFSGCKECKLKTEEPKKAVKTPMQEIVFTGDDVYKLFDTDFGGKVYISLYSVQALTTCADNSTDILLSCGKIINVKKSVADIMKDFERYC